MTEGARGILVLVLMASILLVTASASADVGFVDGTFNNSDWGSVVFVHGNGGTSVGTQVTTGGNPGSYWRITNTINSSPVGPGEFSSVWAFYFRAGATYNPPTNGPISSIDSSQDAIVLDNSGSFQSIRVGLRQNGQVYSAGGNNLRPAATTWNSVSFNGLTANDFARIDPIQGYPTDLNAHPDFSSTGSTIEFGFLRTNSTAFGGAGYSVIGGVDNWSLVVHNQQTSISTFAACINGLQVDVNGVALPGASVTNISWSWGDGQQIVGFFPQAHTYSTPGQYPLQVTAHYSDGSSASTSQTVNVAPGILSNCLSLMISAELGGSVSYRSSVASGIVPTNASVVLELASQDFVSLTAHPDPGNSFVAWSPTTGLTGFNGGPIPTSSLAINIVVHEDAQHIGAIFSVGAEATFLGPPGTTTNPTASYAEPVNTATGNYYSSSADLVVRGRGLPFVFKRYYNSRDLYSGPLGVGWTHTYNVFISQDVSGRTVTIKQGDGSAVSFNKDTSGFYTSSTPGLFDTLQTNTDGSLTLTRRNQTKLIFAPDGKLAAVTDRNGNAQILTYARSGDLATIVDTVGRTFAVSYDSNHRLVSLTDPSGRRVAYSYDSVGNLASYMDPAGNVTTYRYDAAHHLVDLVDPRGVTSVQNVYDASGRVVIQKNGRGIPIQLVYSTPGGTTTITDGNGNLVRHVYDANLRLIGSIDGVGAITRFAYDANNNRTGITDPNGNTTAFSYDSRGNVLSTTNALGNMAVFTYDALNDLTSMTDPARRTTTLSYDANGSLLTIRDALGNVTRYSYDTLGELLSATDAVGTAVKLTWDDTGNLLQVIDGEGRMRTFAYDTLGRATSLTDGLGQTTRARYDVLGRVLGLTDPLGHSTEYAYDPIGNLVSVTDRNGNKTSYNYDAVGNLTLMVDALGQQTSYTYDGNNNRLTLTNARRKTTSYAYDAANRRITVTDPLGRPRTVTYDAIGNILAATDGNAKTTQFVYDALNRLVGTLHADGHRVSYVHDVAGNRISMTDDNGTTAYGYDALNRLASVTRLDGQMVTYTHDAVGRRQSLTYPDGGSVRYTYDGSSKLTEVTDRSGLQTTYAYDAAGRLISTVLPNGVESAYAYDAANRLQTLVNAGRTGVLSSFDYVLDNVGNRLKVTSRNGVSSFSYDALSRLVSWTAASGETTRYVYDAVGNRTSTISSSRSMAYTYDDADELLAAGSTVFTYDGNGSRVTSVTSGNTISYGWDARNRLVTVSGPNVNVTYDYDGDGNRITRLTSTASIAYVNDIARQPPVAITEEGSDGSIHYIYGSGLIAKVGSHGADYVTADGLGSTVNVSEDKAAPKVAFEYDPWGTVLNRANPLGADMKYTFTGQAFDADSGLYYMRARYYDPSVGRFLSRDPIGTTVGSPFDQNRYAYARNNPVKYVDPSGLGSQDVVAVPDATSETPLAPVVGTRELLYHLPATNTGYNGPLCDACPALIESGRWIASADKIPSETDKIPPITPIKPPPTGTQPPPDGDDGPPPGDGEELKAQRQLLQYFIKALGVAADALLFFPFVRDIILPPVDPKLCPPPNGC